MSKTIKEEKKYILILLLLIILISMLFFLPSIINSVPLTFGTDIKPQWFEFYTEFKNLVSNFIHNKELPFYSWDLFLGNNFWASKSYYLIGDIYNYIGLLFDDNFFDIARNLSFLKFIVGGVGFYFYLTELDHKPITKVIVSLAFVFSGWAVFFSGQLVFLSFYSFIPLYLIGIERSLKNKSPWIFILSCALLFSTNFYFFYTLTIFSPIYFIYRYYVLGLPLNKFYKYVLKQILYYILGISITAVFWFPGVLYIVGSDRFTETSKDFNIFVYLHLLFSSFVPNYLYIYRNNVFETNFHFSREICLWASSILIVLLPQFYKLFSKKEKVATIAMYILFVVIAIIPELDSAMHGFGDPSFRWLFLVVIFNLYIIANVLDNIDKLNKKLLIISFVSIILIMLFTFFLAIYLRGESINDYLKQFTIMLVFILVIVIGSFVIYSKKINLLLILITLELSLSGMYCYGHDVKSKPNDTYEYIEKATHNIQTYPNEIMNAINSLKEENGSQFIRLYIPLDSIYWDFSHNMSLHYGIKGLMTYDSTYATSFISMYEMEPTVSAYKSRWIFDIKDDNLMSFLNTKYAIVSANDELSENWTLVNDDYHYGFKIYENTKYRPLGTTYSKIMTEDEYKIKKDTSMFLNHVICDDSCNDINKYISDANGVLKDIYYKGNYLSANYESDKDGFMILGIPYDEGWNILVDDEEINYYDVNGGFIGFNVLEGNHKVQMSFIPKGFKAGLLISILGILSTTIFATIRCIQNKKKL